MARGAERRIPTPLVLAGASAMVCVGIVAWWVALGDRPAEEVPPPPGARPLLDDSTPERTAESFLDAWRKRAHEGALALSTGEAHAAVLERQARDAALSAQERALKQQVWDTMAASRLSLRVEESETLEGGLLALRGRAEGTFLERPYVREVEMVLRELDGGWRVERIGFGDILSDVPDVLELDPAPGDDPSAFEMRGDEVP